jgi:hypothetical protein
MSNIGVSLPMDQLIATVRAEALGVFSAAVEALGVLALVGLLVLTISGCQPQAMATQGESTPLLASEVAPPVAIQAPSTSQPTLSEEVTATPTKVSPSTPTPPPIATPNIEAEAWRQICQPSPIEEGKTVANLALGSRVELRGYLYVNPFPFVSQGLMPLILKEIPYPWGADITEQMGWADVCEIYVSIPIGSGPNNVIELPSRFQLADVVVWDKNGQEMQGWQKNLDSFHVLVVGVVIETYGKETGLGGSNNIRLEELELLEPSLFSQ